VEAEPVEESSSRTKEGHWRIFPQETSSGTKALAPSDSQKLGAAGGDALFGGRKPPRSMARGVNVGFRAGSADGGEEVWKAAHRIHGFGKPGMIADRS
jgi:hypothetical protein